MPKAGSKNIIVIYHATCPDGFGAAWAAWKKFGAKAEYYAVTHSDIVTGLAGKEVYFLDLVYPVEVMRKIAGQVKNMVVIDHHATASDAVKLANESIYYIEHSGAFLAWEYFHPGKAVPKLLLHIEDEDLWKFKLAGTRAVNARLEIIDFDFKKWDGVTRAFEKAAYRKKFIAEGELLAGYRTEISARIVKEAAVTVKFAGHRALAVNGTKPFTSEIGHMLCKILPPIGIVWQERNGRVSVSLRSDGTVDVSKIAEKYGGGGHKAAAAFAWPLKKPKPWTYE